ncbi:MAG: hypothetical protein AAGA29_04410 [Planctomycetota bacterium]
MGVDHRWQQQLPGQVDPLCIRRHTLQDGFRRSGRDNFSTLNTHRSRPCSDPRRVTHRPRE